MDMEGSRNMSGGTLGSGVGVGVGVGTTGNSGSNSMRL
jgi:hypothetical protein